MLFMESIRQKLSSFLDSLIRALTHLFQKIPPSLAWSIIYGIFCLISFGLNRGWWMLNQGIYVLTTGIRQLYLLKQDGKTGCQAALPVLVTIGIVLYLMILFTGMIRMLLSEYHIIRYPLYLIYAAALWTFYCTGSALRPFMHPASEPARHPGPSGF